MRKEKKSRRKKTLRPEHYKKVTNFPPVMNSQISIFLASRLNRVFNISVFSLVSQHFRPADKQLKQHHLMVLFKEFSVLRRFSSSDLCFYSLSGQKYFLSEIQRLLELTDYHSKQALLSTRYTVARKMLSLLMSTETDGNLARQIKYSRCSLPLNQLVKQLSLTRITLEQL